MGEEINGGVNVNMDVAAVLVYDRAVTVAERLQIESQLRGRFLSTTTPSNSAPIIAITDPPGPAVVVEGTALSFIATATDVEDGDLSPAVSWSSDLDGPLGTGATISSVLSAGQHSVTASVQDSGGILVLATVAVTVFPDETGGGDSPPPVTVGLVAHYRSDSTGVTSDPSGLVMIDQTSNGNDLFGVGNVAVGSELTPSGLSAMSLDGNGDYFERLDSAQTPITGLPLGGTDRSVFFVVRYDAMSAYSRGLVGFRPSESSLWAHGERRYRRLGGARVWFG